MALLSLVFGFLIFAYSIVSYILEFRNAGIKGDSNPQWNSWVWALGSFLWMNGVVLLVNGLWFWVLPWSVAMYFLSYPVKRLVREHFEDRHA